jgi:hypothetical protein
VPSSSSSVRARSAFPSFAATSTAWSNPASYPAPSGRASPEAMRSQRRWNFAGCGRRF